MLQRLVKRRKMRYEWGMMGGIAVGMIAAGGAIGTMLRAMLVGRLLPFTATLNFPVGILTVNILGSFTMGVLVGILMRVSEGGYSQGTLYLFFGAGVLGGFTTFSAFALDIVFMIQKGQYQHMALYIVLSVGLSVAAVLGGMLLTRPKIF